MTRFLQVRPRIQNALFAVAFAIVAVTCTASPHPSATTPPGGSPGGKGLFLLDVDYETGRITEVHVLESTGDPKIDASAIRSFKKWKAKPRKFRHIKVPFTYTKTQ